MSHLLGCLLIIVASLEPPEDNWLHHYDPALMDADPWSQYVVGNGGGKRPKPPFLFIADSKHNVNLGSCR